MTVEDGKRPAKPLALELAALVRPDRVRAALVEKFAEDLIYAIAFRGDAFEIVRRSPLRGLYDCVVEGEVLPLRYPDQADGPFRSGGAPGAPTVGTIVRARARPAGALRVAAVAAVVGFGVLVFALGGAASIGRLSSLDSRVLALFVLFVVALATGIGALLRAGGIADARVVLAMIHRTAYSVPRSG